MSFKLALDNYVLGLEVQSALVLAALQNIATLTPPILEADMRNQLETGQFQAFSNAGWGNFLSIVQAISLDESVLTAAEVSIMNTLRAAVNPPPSFRCCGITPVVSALTSIGANARIGSATFEHEIEIKLLGEVDCNIKSIDVTLTPNTVEPVLTSANPFKVLFKECNATGDQLFSFLWATYGADPTGGIYTINYDFKDSTDASITTFVPAYTLTMP